MCVCASAGACVQLQHCATVLLGLATFRSTSRRYIGAVCALCRQRKKKKHSDLQTALDALTEKLALLDTLGKEAAVLRTQASALNQQLAMSEASSMQARAMIQRQSQVLAGQQVCGAI